MLPIAFIEAVLDSYLKRPRVRGPAAPVRLVYPLPGDELEELEVRIDELGGLWWTGMGGLPCTHMFWGCGGGEGDSWEIHPSHKKAGYAFQCALGIG